MLRVILALHIFISISLACKCKTYSWKSTFEEAKWISHFKVNSRKVLPDRRSLIYNVHHIDTYKKNEEINEQIFTLASSSGCGVPDLKVGQEYLAAGTFANGKEPRLISCLMFVKKADPTALMGAIIWDDVPPELLKMLKSGDFEQGS